MRTLLIHAYRRVLLRDPLLAGGAAAARLAGRAAYALCRDFYRLTHRDAESHLAATLSEPGDTWPAASESFYRRFDGLPRD